MIEPCSLNFKVSTVKLVDVQKFKNFTVACFARLSKFAYRFPR